MSDRDQRFSEATEEPTQDASTITQPTTSTTREKMMDKMHRMHDKIGKLHLFASFCERPSNVTFQTQEPDEQVLVFLRKSQWVNFPWIFTTAIFLIIPLVLYFLHDSFLTLIPPLNVILVIIPFYYLLVAIYAFVNFVTWYYNAALITNKRVVDIDFHQIVFKDVAETKLALVQDVSYNQTGVLPNILGYGFVLIQTAGTLDNFEFHNLPHPDRVEEIVEDLIGGKRFYEP